MNTCSHLASNREILLNVKVKVNVKRILRYFFRPDPAASPQRKMTERLTLTKGKYLGRCPPSTLPASLEPQQRLLH